MIVLYATETGELLEAYYDRDAFVVSPSINIPFGALEIDEVDPENREICRAVVRSIGRYDAQSRQRFYVDSGQLWEREDWSEHLGGPSDA